MYRRRCGWSGDFEPELKLAPPTAGSEAADEDRRSRYASTTVSDPSSETPCTAQGYYGRINDIRRYHLRPDQSQPLAVLYLVAWLPRPRQLGDTGLAGRRTQALGKPRTGTDALGAGDGM